MRGPVQSVDVSYLVHSTEDAAKIESAVEGLLGILSDAQMAELEGHYGNRILHVTHHLTGEEAASAFSSLMARLSEEHKSQILKNLEGMMDEHSALYVRLDKGSLISGRETPDSGETIRIRIKPRLFQMKEGAADFYRRALKG